MNPARICRFSRPVPYTEAVSLQEQLVRLRVDDRIPDTLLLLEHPPVITLGRRGRREHLLADETRLDEAGVELATSSRGGDVTYHAPGQWVLYPILKLGPNEIGAHGYLKALEDIAIHTARTFGVDADRRAGKAGAWCARGKFAAIGFKFTRWVTWHGMSLNVNLDLNGFSLIHGCGLVGEPVTSLHAVLGDHAPGMDAVAVELIHQASHALQRDLRCIHARELLHTPCAFS